MTTPPHRLPLLGLLALAACGDPAGPDTPMPATVEITPGTATFASLGETIRLAATVRDQKGEIIADAAVAWISAHSEVARVDSTGLVTAEANGATTITATAAAATATAAVEVAQVPATIALRLPADSLSVGDSLQLGAEAIDALGSALEAAVFAWESSDSTIVRIGGDWAHALLPGPVTLTTRLGEISASAPFRSLPLTERVALHRLYHAMGGPVWKDNSGWRSDLPLGDWNGVRVDGEGRVVALELTNTGLIGTIPPEIASLPHLQILHIGLNALTGPIPPEIRHLTRLRSLELTYNRHTGAIPPEIGALTELEWLGAFGNELEGEIPPEIGNLRNLEVLDLCYNRLTGPLPPEIGQLTKMRRFAICGVDSRPETGNQLSGAIPPEIGDMAALEMLNLGANRLSGPIPPEIGKLAQLDTLLLYSNELTAIPPEIGQLEGLEWLVLYGNRLEGAIPPEIGRLRNLRALNLGWGLATGRNLLSGAIPPEIGNLESLVHLDLGGNGLSSSIPPDMGRLRALAILELGSNRLTGPIPPEMGEMTALRSLAVCKNELEGPVPPALGGLARLTELYLCTNRLTGPLPPELGELKGLLRLIVAGNRLTSELPPAMVSLVRLREFFWGKNDGLCVPLGDDFDEWLAGIATKGGDRCAAGFGADDPSVAAETGGMTAGELARAATGTHRHVIAVQPQRPG